MLFISAPLYQFRPTTDEQWVIRSLLNAQEALVIDTDFIIEEEDPDGMPIMSIDSHLISKIVIK